MSYLEAWDRFGSMTYAELPEDVKKVPHQCVLNWYGCAVAKGVCVPRLSEALAVCQAFALSVRFCQPWARAKHGRVGADPTMAEQLPNLAPTNV